MTSVNPNRHHPSSDLYLIVLGIVVGMALGPFSLARFAPDTYRNLFVGGTDEFHAEQRFVEDTVAERARLENTGVTEAALTEFDLEKDKHTAVLRAKRQAAQRDHHNWLQDRMTALLLAILVIMVIESLFGTEARRIRARLTTTRYALIAIWLALLIASPTMLKSLPVLFVTALIAVALFVGLIPLGRRSEFEHRM